MPKFNVDDYVMVEDRIKKFREKHPEGQIKTELVASTPDLQSVIVKAEVYDKEGNMLGSDLAQDHQGTCLLYTSPSPRDGLLSRMPSSA